MYLCIYIYIFIYIYIYAQLFYARLLLPPEGLVKQRARASRLSTLKGRSLEGREANGTKSVHEAKSFSRLGLRVPGPYRTL